MLTEKKKKRDKSDLVRRKSIIVSQRDKITRIKKREENGMIFTIRPMRELSGYWKWIEALEKTRLLIVTTSLVGEISNCVHLSTHYALFQFSQVEDRLFFYLLKNEDEYNAIFDYSQLILEIWDYRKDGIDEYIFIKQIYNINSHDD